MMQLEPITRAEQIMSGQDLTPITREEMFLAKAAGRDVETPTPITRRELFLSQISGGSGGGSSDGGGDSAPVIHALEVTENGVYEAPDGVDGYSPITVNVSSSGGEEWIGDGNTHIWITLHEGRTSPILGVCPKGTVTVDWGDGTTPDTLTGTSTSKVKWTPKHNYAEPGDYVITLTVNGTMGLCASGAQSTILHHASGYDTRNRIYLSSVNKVELGNGVTYIGDEAFRLCCALKTVFIPGGVTSIGSYAFETCFGLEFVIISSGVTSIGSNAFETCCCLESVIIPDSVTSIGKKAFQNCDNLKTVFIPAGVKSISESTFHICSSLVSVIIPGGVTSIGSYAFGECGSVLYFDFTHHTAIPTLSNSDAFAGIPADCEIRVPAALHSQWIAATNWATYASQIVAV